MKHEVDACMLFIAELTGSFEPGSGDEKEKIRCGQHDYVMHNLHDLDLTDEEDRKELHENMWLERLYTELDEYFKIPANLPNKTIVRRLSVDCTVAYRTETYKWTVPIELDATSSMCQIIGVLLNDYRLMNMTNVIGNTLEDAWKVEGIPRKKLKAVMTPKLYGSSKTPVELWQSNKMEYTPDDVTLINNELNKGAFGVANVFKDFIINSCAPKATMKIKIWNEEFEISCNRYRNVGEKTKAYKIWDSIDQRYNVLLHTDTKQIPDLDRFRSYFVTLLVHNIDSQIMNTVTQKVMNKYGWGIPIHDAIVVSPSAAADVRQWYIEELAKIYIDRKKILKDYFQSIGITALTVSEQWDAVKNKVVAPEGIPTFNPMALK